MTATDVAEMQELKKKHGITKEIASCHTAFVDGYIVEGHVPAADVQRLLKERPKVAGITVPGMPLGSPGMERDGKLEAYDVLTFTKDGATTVYSSHNKGNKATQQPPRR